MTVPRANTPLERAARRAAARNLAANTFTHPQTKRRPPNQRAPRSRKGPKP